MRTVAYLRVSISQQDVSSHRLANLEYALKHEFLDDFIDATASDRSRLNDVAQRYGLNRKQLSGWRNRRLQEQGPEAVVEDLHAKVVSLTDRNHRLEHLVREMRRAIYAKKSENQA